MTSSKAARRDWILWAALRTMLLLIIWGWIPWPEQINDLAIYRHWADGPLASGRFPDDPMWQYPPLAAPVFRLGALLPGGPGGYALLFLAFDAVIMAMLAGNARSGTGAGRTLWALAPLITGPLLLARFDVVPTTFAVAAVLCLHRPTVAGAVAAVGAGLKAWPLLTLAGVMRRDIPRGALGVVVATATMTLALILIGPSQALSFLSGQRDRGLQIESVGASLFLLARALGLPVEVVYRFGAHEIEAPWVDQIAEASVLLSVLLLGWVAFARLSGRLESHLGADVALATVLFSVASSRVFSTQYFIWLLALVAVSANSPATRLAGTIRLIVAAGAVSQLVYPWLYSALLDGHPVAVALQLLRVGLTVAATLSALRALSRGQAWKTSVTQP